MIPMMSARLVLLAALVIPFAAACGRDKPARPAAGSASGSAPAAGSAAGKPAADPVASRTSAAGRPSPAVRPFQDDTLGFAVEAARTPTRGEQQVPTAIGVLTAQTFMFSSANAPGAMMVVATPSFDKDGDLDLERALEDGLQGMLANMGGTLVESAAVELDGATGRRFRFTARPQGQRATGYGKMFLRDGTLYQILVVHMDRARAFQAEGERFVDSFRFVPRA